MIKLIVTIDTFRGINYAWDLPSAEKYQSRIASKGRLRASQSDLITLGYHESISHYDTIVWVKNGLTIQKELLNHIDELYITQIDGGFDCKEFFPSFEKDFVMTAKGKIKQENNILFQHQVWRARRLGKFQEA